MAYKESKATVEMDGKTCYFKSFIIAIANSSQYGNNARIAPSAFVCDQLLNVNMVKKVPAYRLDFFYELFKGDVTQSTFCEAKEIKHMAVKTSHPVAYHVYGEPCGHDNEFKIEILPEALQVLVPRMFSTSPASIII